MDNYMENLIIELQKENFFDFDEVIHYEVSISEYDFYDLLEKDTISSETKLLSKLLSDPCPTNLEERKQFDEGINLIGVTSNTIDAKFYEALRKQVFVEKMRILK